MDIPALINRRQTLLKNYRAGQIDLLAIIIFTVVNVVLTLTASGSYFLFSAFIPFEFLYSAMLLCGKFPAEWYEGLEGFEFFDESMFYAAIVVVVVFLAIYTVCLVFSSKNRYGWLIAALVVFSLDTLYLLTMFDVSFIVDLAIHVIAIVGLARAVHAGHQLKKIPSDEELAAAWEAEQAAATVTE